MSKLFFYYSAMNAGKSTNLLQASFNYQERGFNSVLFTFHQDNRDLGNNKPSLLQRISGKFSKNKPSLKIQSRIGLSQDALGFDNSTLFIEKLGVDLSDPDFLTKFKEKKIGAIFVDEAQFLTKEQVLELAWIVDELHTPVLCYGLRTDYLGEPFEGSTYLLAHGDELNEMKTICSTGKKATFVLRVDKDGNAIVNGNQIEIGAEDKYISVSRKIHRDEIVKAKAKLEAKSKQPLLLEVISEEDKH